MSPQCQQPKGRESGAEGRAWGDSGFPHSCRFLSSHPFVQVEGPSAATSWQGYLSQHQGLFKWVRSSHQVAKILVFQLQHQFFQWTPRTDHILIQKIKQNIQKTKIRASSPVTSWRTDGETMVRMTDFIFLGSNVTVDSDCCYEIKRLLLGRKAMGNLYGVLKSRDITSLTKVYIVKAMVFPVVMYGCESWATKKAEHWRTDLLNCDVGEDSWESLVLHGDQASQS